MLGTQQNAADGLVCKAPKIRDDIFAAMLTMRITAFLLAEQGDNVLVATLACQVSSGVALNCGGR